MIIVHNISKEYSSTGWQQYEVKVNDKLICTFDHKASNGLSECLRAAGDAVEDKMQIEYEERIPKINFEVRNKQIYQERVFDKMTLKGIAKKHGITKERVRQIVYIVENRHARSQRSDIKNGEFPDDHLLEDIDLSIRVRNCLKLKGIKTVGEIKNMTIRDIFRIKNFGRKSYLELQDVIWGDNKVLWEYRNKRVEREGK